MAMKLSTALTRIVLVGAVFTVVWALLLALHIPGMRNGLIPGRHEFIKIGPLKGHGMSSLRHRAGLDQPGAASSVSLTYPQKFKIYISPRPSPSPEPEVYNLRNCECSDDWKAGVGGGKSLCKCGGKDCPNRVNPRVRACASVGGSEQTQVDVPRHCRVCSSPRT